MNRALAITGVVTTGMVVLGLAKRLKNAVEETLESKARTEFLSEASKAITRSLDYHSVMQSLAKLAIPFLADLCVVLDKNMKGIAVEGDDPEVTKLAKEAMNRFALKAGEDSVLAKVMTERKSLLISDVTDEHIQPFARSSEHLNAMKSLGIRSGIAVPLVVRDEVIGIVVILLTKPGRRYGKEDLSLAEEFALRAAMALDNARLYGEARSAIELRDEFMAIASHELKTPLTPLKIQLQFLERVLRPELAAGGPRTQGFLKQLESSENQVDRLTRLVGDILDVSRISHGRLSLSFERFDLSELVIDVVQRFSGDLAKAKSPTEVNCRHGVVGEWDRLRIEQVVVNLLTNAMKYGAGKPIQIAVTSDEQKARIYVKDYGIGVSETDKDRIFKRFERAVPPQNFGGLGIGLYITRQIVEAHGGTVTVDSEPGEGATFKVELPLVRKAN